MIAVDVFTDMGVVWLIVAVVVSLALIGGCGYAINRRDHRALDRRNAERNRRKP